MTKLLLPPNQSGYGVDIATENLSVKLEGGASKFRKDIFGGSHDVPCSWQCNPEQYGYIMAFFRTVTQRGALPFEVDLTIEGADVKEYTARFLPGTFKLASQEGATWNVQAVLEVEQPTNETEAEDDAAIVEAYEEAHGT